MRRRASLLALVPVLLAVSLASAQESYPLMEMIAKKVIEQYQTSSFQDLAQWKNQPPTQQQAHMEQRATRTTPRYRRGGCKTSNRCVDKRCAFAARPLALAQGPVVRCPAVLPHHRQLRDPFALTMVLLIESCHARSM